MVLIGYSGTWRKMICDKNQKLKISCQTSNKLLSSCMFPLYKNAMSRTGQYFVGNKSIYFISVKKHSNADSKMYFTYWYGTKLARLYMLIELIFLYSDPKK
jgi:hypothetical protein